MLVGGRMTFRALGTGVVVNTVDAGRLDPAVAAVRAVLDDVDRSCSRFRNDSELERVNRAAGATTAVGPTLVTALRVALDAARSTDGDLDPTVGEAIRVLGYDRDFGSVDPTGPPVMRIARVSGWRTVELDDRAGTVRLPAGVRLDLGATAKAFAADRAAAEAATAAGCGVLVGIGGDLATAGPASTDGWPVGIATSHAATDDEIEETILISGGGVATSSTAVRRWQRGGATLHHIVDPRTGRPAEPVWRVVSVAASSCLGANVASTASIIRGAAAPAWLESLGVPARLVRRDGTVVRLGAWPAASPP